LQIEQNIGKHHRFQMSVELETGSNRYVHNINSSKDWLGESIVVKAANKPIFVGVVTNVQLHREGSDFGCIIVSGYSATYRMETAHSCFSWNDTTIGNVVKKLCAEAKVQLELNPEFKETKDFICQYEESDFDFIRRLAYQYQEWMYFDGTKLIFGKPRKLADPIRLEYGTTLSSLDIGLQTLARSEQVFSYHSGADREMQRMTPDLAYGHDKLAGEAFRASLGMFSKPARQHALPRISNETELVNYMGRKQAAETAETHYITAESQVPTLRVGSVVSLYSSFLERVGNLSEESLGDFIIIEITHEVSQGSYYKNRFKAIPATLKALPSPKVRMPLAETQMATVLSNADPEGKGRVRVRMNWQTDGMQTGWVRVMTPDGGSSKDVKSNRGFVFIPEVGDQVLLGFRHGDPARPYVMGSLFNGTTGGGGGQGNNCKSLTTRSGSSLKLDDSAGSVTLHDKGGVSMNFDGGGNLSITSKISHTVNSGEIAKINVGGKKDSPPMSALTMDNKGVIDLTGQKRITFKVGDSSIIMSADGNITISCKQYKIDAEVNTEINVRESYLRLYPTLAFLHSKTMTQLNSENVINVHSGKVIHINGQKFVNIKGKLIKLNS
ncbi:phage baseplate assembly protein V, partial [Prevotella melaninogenica]|uniref:type VI secretion system Vgr family protein n=1 Tax=Prevotella melaninogenica TaxID=28132 RepID=UPI0028EDCB8A